MVLVSHRYKFIYLKNYKVAGTSVEAFFAQFCVNPIEQLSYRFTDECNESNTSYGIVNRRYGEHMNSEIKEHVSKWMEYIHNDNRDRSVILWFPHKSAKHIKEDLGHEMFNCYFKFCVVRNPYDVVVSAYYWCKVYPPNLNTNDNFKDFCINFCKNIVKLKTDNYIRHDNNRLFIDNNMICNYYIRYEHLKDDIVILLEKLGINEYNLDQIPQLKTKHRPKDRQYREYYDDETRELVYQTFKQICVLFNYTF